MKKRLKIIGYVLLTLGIIWIIIYLIPAKERPNQAFFREDDPDTLVIAHAGALHLAPANTMEAFENAYEMGVDILEYDVHITADGHLVTIHDDTVDRTTDGTGKVNEMTLEEVQSLDAGYTFEDLDGEYSFRGQGVKVPTVEEVLTTFPDTRHLIELKNTNDEELWEDMIQEMWRLVEEHQMHDQVMIASFTHEINERFQDVSNHTVAIGAGEEAVRPYAISHILYLNGLFNPNADAFQLPTDQLGISLVNENIIQGAHDRGMHVYYWTINDEETMEELIEIGADGIVTDRPDILLELLDR